MAVLVRPHPRESRDGEAVRLTVRANSAGSNGDGDPVESHSDPNDPWHRVGFTQLCL